VERDTKKEITHHSFRFSPFKGVMLAFATGHCCTSNHSFINRLDLILAAGTGICCVAIVAAANLQI
jgi:hypothetical protein